MTGAEGGHSGRTVARAGGQVAVAAVVSRLTGFLRTLLLAAALGTAAVADAYNGANSFPNMVYELLLGGLLSSLFIPMLMRARLRGRQYTDVFTQRVLAAGTLAMALLTMAAVAAAPLLVAVMVTDRAQRELTTLLAYLLLPQIFFYALAAMVTAVLNVGGSFAAPAWAPVINNVIVVITVVAFLAAPGPVTLAPASMTGIQVSILGVGTTLGVSAQAIWAVVALRRSGFRWSWRVRILPYTWRPVQVGLPLLGWVMAYAAISQVGVAVTLRVAFGHGGVSIYTYADLIFQVCYGILGVSLLTVLMPRIAHAVVRADTSAVVADLGRGARYAIVALIPMTIAVSVLAPALSTVIFVGHVDVEAAHLIGVTAAAAAFGLVPLALVMLQMRVFYAGNDARTPALINMAMVVTKIVVIVVAAALLPSRLVVVMLGVGASLSFVVGAAVGHVLLRRRYGLLGFHQVAATLGRVSLAALIAGGCCLAVVLLVKTAVTEPRMAALVALVAGAATGLAAFFLAAHRIGIPELRIVRALLQPARRAT